MHVRAGCGMRGGQKQAEGILGLEAGRSGSGPGCPGPGGADLGIPPPSRLSEHFGVESAGFGPSQRPSGGVGSHGVTEDIPPDPHRQIPTAATLICPRQPAHTRSACLLPTPWPASASLGLSRVFPLLLAPCLCPRRPDKAHLPEPI